MYQVKERKIATREMAIKFIEKDYEEELPKTEALIKSFIGDYKATPEVLQKCEEALDDAFNNGKMLERIDEFEDKTIVLADLAGILEDEYIQYKSREEFEMYLNFFVRESAEVLSDLLLVLHQAKVLVK